MRRLSALVLVLALFVTGCGGSSKKTTAGTAAAPAATQMSSGASPTSGTGASGGGCPTSNTQNFAKTRFVADLGGAAFLARRYLYTPYQQGKFKKGASGRTFALVKAAAAAATTAKLLKNASVNAKANPTLCKTVAGPLAQASTAVSGLVGQLKSGGLTGGALGGLASQFGNLKSLAGKAGVQVPEKSIGLGG